MTIAAAAELLRTGGVVAFPTETVYGLGASALDAGAVRKIYELKGRPATSPLIVHVASREMARGLASTWPAAAEELARRYWPGPLTLVVPKSPAILDAVTAGLPSVGLRMPRHPLALELIAAAGVPLAAPSANPFTRISPTTAAHVREAFGDVVPVIDGGPCEIGIESTVVAVDADGGVRLLRPGMIRLPDAAFANCDAADGVAHEAPGMHRKHYSPKSARVLLLAPGENPPLDSVYVWHTVECSVTRSLRLPADAEGYAAGIYAALHELDARAVKAIAVEAPPEGPEWEAVRDRLRRAAQAD